MSLTLAIKPGLHFARVETQGVVMDLLADRYLGLGAWGARLWTALEASSDIHDLVRSFGDEGVPLPVLRERIDRQLQAWRAAGLLVTGAAAAPAAVPRPRPSGAPASHAIESHELSATPMSIGAAVRVLRSALWTWAGLRWRRLAWTLVRLQRVPVRDLTPEARYRVTLRTVRAFVALRMLAHQGRLDCLPRSVALAHALRRQGVDAEVCFGVRNYPFLAHAWVEADGTALNEKPERIQPFTVVARF